MHFVNAKTILSAKNGMNIYRGCTHGCIYCDSRSACYQMHHAFEDIEVKQNAPQLLEDSLCRKRKKCMIGTGSMCDPYMHCETELRLTRRCLEVIDRHGFGATVITKSAGVLRDLDLLKSINEHSKAVVQMTLTTYNEDLCRIVEPNVSTTRERYQALKILRDNGISTIVWLSPLLPLINDTAENLSGILDYCFDSGVRGILCFGIGMTLREGNREYYYKNLDRYFPGIRAQYEKCYGNAYSIASANNAALMRQLYDECAKHGVMTGADRIFGYLSELPTPPDMDQLSLF